MPYFRRRLLVRLPPRAPERVLGSAPAAPSLGRGAAFITLATAVSRVTGFLRVVAVAAAMGTTFLANTYQSANTAPNLVFELLAAGVLTSVFVPTFVDHLVRGEREEGWNAANALTSVALVALTAVALIVALFAPQVMRLFLIGVRDPEVHSASVDLGARFLRLFAPQIVFYGAGMIMTAALHAHRRFAMPAIAPIFNNVIVIGIYVTYVAMRGDAPVEVGTVTDAETFVLGLGTTAGVVAMTVCLIPSLRKLGWKFRFRFEPSHPAVRRGARLGIWALSYAGGYQAGLIVVLILANRLEGGVAAYQWAYTFFYLPHALFGVPIFHVLFTAMAEHASRRERGQLVERLRDGIGMLWFVLIPIGTALLVLAEPISRLTLEYGVMTGSGARLVARTLGAFALGTPTFSTFLVLTRAFYAIGDTKTPALVNLVTVTVASVAGATAFFAAPREWAVPGLALGHSVGATLGCVVLARLLMTRLDASVGTTLGRSLRRSLVAGLPVGLAMWAGTTLMPGTSKLDTLAEVVVAGAAGMLVYVAAMLRAGAPELTRLASLARNLMGRR